MEREKKRSNLSVKQNLEIRIVGFWTVSIIRHSRKYKARRFGNWICFRPQVRGGEIPTLLSLLERTNLNHLRTETDSLSETLCFLVYKILGNGQSPERR
jgi:hypothetical protein